MNIRDNIKKQCRLHNITQKELAAKIGITETALSMTITKNNPQLSTLEKIAEGLGITVSQLLSDEQEKTQQTEQRILHVPYARCPHCGGKIELYVKAIGSEEQEDIQGSQM